MATPDIRSYNGMLFSLGLVLQDVARCRVTSVTNTTTFASDDLKVGEDNDLANSEIWFEEITGMGTLRNPFLVSSNVAASGQVVINKAYGAAGPAANLLFTIGNVGGAGFPHQQKFDALLMALADAGMFTRSVANATLDAVNYWHTIPGSLYSITEVGYTNSLGQPINLPPSVWRDNVDRQNRKLYLPYDFSGAQTLAITGRTIVAPPNVDTLDYTAVATQRPSDIVRSAAGWIRGGQIGRNEQANAQALQAIAMRRLRQTLSRNEIMLGEA